MQIMRHRLSKLKLIKANDNISKINYFSLVLE